MQATLCSARSLEHIYVLPCPADMQSPVAWQAAVSEG